MRHHGFTLIELLVVIAIMAILMAIGLPALSRANDEAFRSQCEVRLQLIRLACEEHGQDYGAYPDRLEQLVARGYIDSVTVECSKTGRAFFYQKPGTAESAPSLYWLSCVEPSTPEGERPHGQGTSLLGVTTGGKVGSLEQAGYGRGGGGGR